MLKAPAGMRIVWDFLLGVFPLPLQDVHGSEMILPFPSHRRHFERILRNPMARLFVMPVPPQSGHTGVEVPFLAPEPSHGLQFSRVS